MDFKNKIAELQLPENSYIVVGSGILSALGIRESSDIDLVVSDDVFQSFGEAGWKQGLWGDDPVFQKDIFDVCNVWYGKTVEDLLHHAQVVDGVPYLSLDDVYEWKRQKGREKDLRDMELIDEYRVTRRERV